MNIKKLKKLLNDLRSIRSGELSHLGDSESISMLERDVVVEVVDVLKSFDVIDEEVLNLLSEYDVLKYCSINKVVLEKNSFK